MTLPLFYVVRDLRLPATEKLVLFALAAFAGGKDECFPSQTALIDATGLSERSVRRGLAGLEARSIVRCTRRRQGNLYVLTPTADRSVWPVSPASVAGDSDSEPVSVAGVTGQCGRSDRSVWPVSPASVAGTSEGITEVGKEGIREETNPQTPVGTDQPEPLGKVPLPSPSGPPSQGRRSSEPEPEPKKSREELYAAAYERGIARGKGSPYVFPGGFAAQGDLNRTLPKFARGTDGKALRGDALLAWIEAKAEAFAEFASGEDPKFWSSYNPKGFQRWLNERGADDDDQGDEEHPYAPTTPSEIRPDPSPEQKAAHIALMRATEKRFREVQLAKKQLREGLFSDEEAS